MKEEEAEALVLFLQALAISIWEIFDVELQGDRRMKEFLLVLDDRLEGLLPQAEGSSQNVSEGTRKMREVLDSALRDVPLLKAKPKTEH